MVRPTFFLHVFALCCLTFPLRLSAQVTDAEEVVSAFLEAYNSHDITGMLQFIDSNFVWLSIVGDTVLEEVRGHEALVDGLTDYFKQFPSARSEIEQSFPTGPWLAARERAFWMVGENEQSQTALSVYEVRNGLILRVWYYSGEP